MAQELPPLPRSDSKALEWNINDSYYQVKSGDFWKHNQLIKEEVREFEKCDHKFKATPGGVQCTKCHFGLMGQLEVRDGKLFYKGEPLDK